MSLKLEDPAAKIALVTGGSGFVGAHLIRLLLATGWTVHAVVRPASHAVDVKAGLVWHYHDGSMVRLAALLQAVRPHVVFHLASLFLAQHRPQDVDGLIASNVLFGSQLLEAMDQSGTRCLVNAGTTWQNYRNQAYSPVNLYAATKQAFEDVACYYVEARQLRMITLRLSDTYGPDDPRPKLFALLKRALASNEVLDMSPGEQLLDLVYIDDVVAAFLLAGERLLQGHGEVAETYAVTSGRPVALKELVERFVEAAGGQIPVRWGGRSYRPREVMSPPHVHGPLPGWQAKVSLEEGLARVAADPGAQ